ncbi:MAG: type II toxin-antitoxin system RelE/ParE family toxin [Halothiobacillus sp.]
MSFSFHPAAEQEFNQAVDYYTAIEFDLGRDFAVEIYSAIQRAVEFPQAWPVFDADIRRCLVRRFPYAVLYAQSENKIFIIAVMSLHRHPDYWQAGI